MKQSQFKVKMTNEELKLKLEALNEEVWKVEKLIRHSELKSELYRARVKINETRELLQIYDCKWH